MFDTMTEEAIAEMTSERARLQANASMRRNSSVPPQTPTRVDHGERNAFNALGKGSLGEPRDLVASCLLRSAEAWIIRY